MTTGRAEDRAAPPMFTILAFDFGTRRIGVAVGNSLTRGAQPVEVVSADNDAQRFLRIGELIRQWQPGRLVVGRPVHPDGAPHEMTRRSERFARQLQGRFGLPVAQVDERYSSVDVSDDEDARGRFAQAAGRERGRRGRTGGANGPDASARGRAREPVDADAAAILLRQYWGESGDTGSDPAAG